MKEPYGEGLASHTGPESCATVREDGREALTGAHAGGVLSREIIKNQSADAVHRDGRQHRRTRKRVHPPGSARSKTPACMGNSTREIREALPTPEKKL